MFRFAGIISLSFIFSIENMNFNYGKILKMNIIHIGFPKTATTFLQKVILNQLPDQVNYVNNTEAKILFYKIYNNDDCIFDRQDVLATFNSLCDRRSSINLFSYEFLTGLHHQTGFINRSLIAKRLMELGFQKIIITIRNQFDVLESAYKQYIKDGGVLKFTEFFNLKGKNSQGYFPLHYLDLEYYNYFRIIKLYSNLFGFNNICILQYEDLKKDLFTGKLMNFLSLPDLKMDVENYINKSLSKRETQILRIINHFTFNTFRPSHLISEKISTRFFYRVLNFLPDLTSGKNRSFVTDEIRSFISSYYKSSNNKLVSEYNLKLDSSYPL
jgi:hypothetical protein